MEKKYPLLKVEKTKKESLDIKLLHFLWLYSDVSKFHIKLNNRYLLRFLIGLHIPFKLLYEIISCLPGKIVNVLNRIVFKFQGSEIQIERMGLRKIMLLEKQIGRSSGGGEYLFPGVRIYFIKEIDLLIGIVIHFWTKVRKERKYYLNTIWKWEIIIGRNRLI